MNALINFLLFVEFVQFVAAFPSDNVLLVINNNSTESTSIGKYYAAKRNITHICRIRTAESESVSRNTFENEILRPVANCLKSNSLQDRILYIVTTRGIPMTVEGDRLSVDSGLTLTYPYMLTGKYPYQARIENPYFAVTGNFRPFLRRDFDIYLVTRLTSRELVDRALTAETGGNFYFDLISPQESIESDWVQEAAALLKKSGYNVTLENTAKSLDKLDRVQGYAAQRSADAPSINWRPGAIADILDKEAYRFMESYITSGVTGLGSYVADPLPDGYFRPQLLFPAYTSGYNLAESFYASCRYLGSSQVVIGDPLVSPYAASPAASQATGMDKETGLPEIFAQRRMAGLMNKYSTRREALVLLMQAEAAESRGDKSSALALAGKSLDMDPLLAEASQLKSRLIPPPVTATAEPSAQSAQAQPEASPKPATSTQPAVAETPESSQNFPVRIISSTPIKYPGKAKDANLQGPVVLELLIDEMGQLMSTKIIQGDKKLAKVAVNAVKSWRFEPKMVNGRAVVSTYTLPITFNLKDATNSTNPTKNK